MALVAPGVVSAQTTAKTPPPTCKLFASASTVAPNTRVRLDWSSTNASSAYLAEVGAIPTNGFAYVVPGKNTTYNASFIGAGGSVVCRVGVSVQPGASVPAGGGIGPPINIDTNKPVDLNRPVTLPNVDLTSPVVQTNTISSGGLFGSLVPNECRSRPGEAGVDPLNTVKNCDLCAMGQMVQNIVNFLLGLTVPAAALLFAWAGILYFSSRGNQTLITRAHKIFTTVLIGFALALGAWVLVNTVVNMLVTGKDLQNWSWKTLDCQGTRQMKIDNKTFNSTIGDYLSSSLPGLTSYQQPVFISPGATTGGGMTCDNTTGLCKNSAGVVLNPSGGTVSCEAYIGVCTDNATGAVVGTTKVKNNTGPAGQCSNANCSPNALKDAGFNDTAANVMSCIAITENSGNSSGCNGNACGTFQIMLTANQLNGPSCAQFNDGNPTLNCPALCKGANGKAAKTEASCAPCVAAANNAQCNAESAAALYNSSGYKPWTTQSDNTKSGACVTKYGNN